VWKSADTSNYAYISPVGDTSTQYFYIIQTRHQNGKTYDKLSKMVGEFDRHLTNESPKR
jgi:hypothetical protein